MAASQECSRYHYDPVDGGTLGNRILHIRIASADRPLGTWRPIIAPNTIAVWQRSVIQAVPPFIRPEGD